MVAKNKKKSQPPKSSSPKKTSKRKPSKLQIGMIIGGITAAAAALFLAPRIADPKKRKALTKKIKDVKKKLTVSNIDQKVKDIFGESTAKTKKIYEQAREGVVLKVAALKDSDALDRKKYEVIVNQVLDVVKKEYSEESKRIENLKQQLFADWKKLDSKKKKSAGKKSTTKKNKPKKVSITKSPAKKKTTSKK